MNELEVQPPQTVDTVVQQVQAQQLDQQTYQGVVYPGDSIPARVKAHVDAANMAWDVARLYCSSNAVPANFKGKISDTAIAILQGAQFGFDPLTSLNNINIIHGRASLSSRALHGMLKINGYRLEVHEKTDTCCRVTIHDPRTGESATEEWTTDRARRMGLGYSKDGKPTMWQKDPRNMLFQRAVAYCAREIAPHLLLGLPYTSDEVQDMEAVEESAAANQVQTAPVQQVQSITVERVQGAPDLVQVCAQIQQAKTVEQLQRIMSQTEGMSDEDKVTLKEQADRKYNQLAPAQPVQPAQVVEGEYVEVDHY